MNTPYLFRRARVFHTILTHQLHLDEVLAVVILRVFGLAAGYDVSKAKIEVLGGNNLPDGASPDTLERDGTLCLGEGGGRLDEHGKKGAAAKKCAALLVAEELGVAEHPALKGLLDEVRQFDRKAEATKTAFGTVMKNRYIAGRVPQAEVIEWALAGIHDLVTFFVNSGAMLVDPESYSAVFGKAWQQAAADGKWTDQMYGRVAGDFTDSVKNDRKLYTDLSYLYYIRVAISGKDVADAWLFEAAYDFVVYQGKWFAARDEFLKKAVFDRTKARIDGRDVTVTVAFVRSDSSVMDKVYRSTDVLKKHGQIDVLVQRKGSGHVAIFFNHKSKLPSDNLARMLRWTEIVLSGRTPHGWRGLCRSDIMHVVPQWYYHRADEIGKSAFYNGSLSHPHVMPTKIDPRDLMDIVCHSFHPSGVAIWCRHHDVPEDDKPVSTQLTQPVIPQGTKVKIAS